MALADPAFLGGAAATPDPADGPTVRVALVVEDDALVRWTTSELIQDLGCHAIEAGSAEEAMTALASTAVDVVITDLGLPGLSGGEFAAQARLLRPGIAIIFATGADQAPVIGGASTLLRKPYDSAALRAALALVGL